MNMRRTLAFTKRALQQFRHDRRTLAFIIAMPLLMITIFGYTFGGEVKNIKVEVVNLDQGLPPGTAPQQLGGLTLAQAIINNIDTDVLKVAEGTDSIAARANVNDSKAWAAIIFPANFTVDLLRFANGQGVSRPVLEIYMEGSNPTISGAVMKAVNEAVLATVKQAAAALNVTSIDLPISLQPSYAYGGGDTQFIDYFAPGVISFAIMMVTIMITIILFVNERRTGTLQRLLASPAGEEEIVLGYSLAFGLIGLAQSVVILAAAVFLFDVTIAGSVVLALFVVFLIGVGHQGFGILLSTGAKNELQAIQFIPLIIFPSILLSGLFWPIESIPPVLQPVSYLIPLRYGIDAERAIMLRGWGIGEIWLDIAVLAFFATLTLGGSVLLLKKRKG
ncbi:MAG: ABC transporter permease [Methanobacteriota archaeon]